jgi:hypothetical protein
MGETAWREAPALPAERLSDLTLQAGAHRARNNGLCAMEAVAWLAGEKHSDQPQCVSPVIGAFMRNWNDSLPTDEDRDRLLKPLLSLTLNTRTTDADEITRATMAQDWIIRVFTPAWLDAAKLTDEAKALRELPEITDIATLRAAVPVLKAAQAKSAAAGAAAWAAARDAAWAAARDAARDAAGAAARDAAWDAAWAAAWAAARAALRPTTEQLQASAAELVQRMCAVGREEG